MPRARKISLILAASLVLTFASGAASARNLSFSNPNIRVTWARLQIVSSLNVECQVTLEGAFHSRRIAKASGSLIGTINRATINEEACTNGRVRPRETPWHITYEGFTGVLPNITATYLLVSRLRLNVIISGFCTAEYGTTEDNLTFRLNREAGGAASSLEPVTGRAAAHRVSGGAFCPSSAELAGQSTSFSASGGGAGVTLFLI